MRAIAFAVMTSSLLASAETLTLEQARTLGSKLTAGQKKQFERALSVSKAEASRRLELEENEALGLLELELLEENRARAFSDFEKRFGKAWRDRVEPKKLQEKVQLSGAQKEKLAAFRRQLHRQHADRLDERALGELKGVLDLLMSHAGAVHGDDDSLLAPPRELKPGQLIGAVPPAMPRPFAPFAEVLDAIGRFKGPYGACTVTHIGEGLALTAGHCVAASAQPDETSCGGASVEWGVLGDGKPSSVSRCVRVVHAAWTKLQDVAVLQLDVWPAAKASVRLRPASAGSAIAVLGYRFVDDGFEALRATPPCRVDRAEPAGRPATALMFGHQCDTMPGQSGAPVFDVQSREIVGVHGGGASQWMGPTQVGWNYASRLDAPPIDAILPVPLPAQPCPQDLTSRLSGRDGGLGSLVLTDDLELAQACEPELFLRFAVELQTPEDGGFSRRRPLVVSLARLEREKPFEALLGRARSACDGGQCLVPIVADTTIHDFVQESFAGGGALENRIAVAKNCGLSHAATGHYEFTWYATRASGFTSGAAALMATATQDVDVYQWFQPAAHAQTPNLVGGALLTKEPTTAQTDFHRWTRCQLERARDRCAAEPDESLYWLGAALHSVQDLLTHKGMSNAEHAGRDGSGEGVDCPTSATNQAIHRVSTALIQDFLERLPASCRTTLLARTPTLTLDELRERTWRKRDRTGISWLSDYLAEGDAYARLVQAWPDEPHRYKVRQPWWGSNSSPQELVSHIRLDASSTACQAFPLSR